MPSAHRMGTQKTAVSHWRESTDPRCARIDWRRRTVSKEMGLSCLNSHEQEVFFFCLTGSFVLLFPFAISSLMQYFSHPYSQVKYTRTAQWSWHSSRYLSSSALHICGIFLANRALQDCWEKQPTSKQYSHITKIKTVSVTHWKSSHLRHF